MFTLKLQERRIVGAETRGEQSDHFIAISKVVAHGEFRPGQIGEVMQCWGDEDYWCVLDDEHRPDGSVGQAGGRLIEYVEDGVTRWVIASHAWLLSPDGRTIERLA